MVVLSNFQKQILSEKAILQCEVALEGTSEKLPADYLWISVDANNEHFLNEKICDGFMLAGMAFGMYYGQDVVIHGKVSKELLFNLKKYVQHILLVHDPGLKEVNILVDGYITENDFEYQEKKVIGAPCSFGVDALLTLYDRWLNETDLDNKIDMVFSFNCGINGAYEDPNTVKLWKDRTVLWEKGFGELGIPVVSIDTNIHQFLHNKMYVYAAACYLSRYFCILNLQGGVKKYYLPSGFSYYDVLNYGHIPYRPIIRGSHDIGLGFEEPFIAPLLSTKNLEFVLDGAQYQRTQKTEKLVDWDFSYRYLNVCQPGRQLDGDYSRNCSKCPKCFYTMFTLEVLGKLDCYSSVFNLKEYYSNKYDHICEMVRTRDEDVLIRDALEFAIRMEISVPSEQMVRKYYFYKWRFPEIHLYIEALEELSARYCNVGKIVWGTGKIGSVTMAAMDCLEINVDCVIDINPQKHNQMFFGSKVQSYQEVDIKGKVIFVAGVDIFREVSDLVGNQATCIDVCSLLKG